MYLRNKMGRQIPDPLYITVINAHLKWNSNSFARADPIPFSVIQLVLQQAAHIKSGGKDSNPLPTVQHQPG